MFWYQCFVWHATTAKVRHLDVFHKNPSPFLFSWYLCQMSTDFANVWEKHAWGNLKQTHVHRPPQIVLYVYTVPCKNWQLFYGKQYSVKYSVGQKLGHFVLQLVTLETSIRWTPSCYSFYTVQCDHIKRDVVGRAYCILRLFQIPSGMFRPKIAKSNDNWRRHHKNKKGDVFMEQF